MIDLKALASAGKTMRLSFIDRANEIALIPAAGEAAVAGAHTSKAKIAHKCNDAMTAYVDEVRSVRTNDTSMQAGEMPSTTENNLGRSAEQAQGADHPVVLSPKSVVLICDLGECICYSVESG
jgi:hypothetical protein